MSNDEKDEYIQDQFEEIKQIEALPEFASFFLEKNWVLLQGGLHPPRKNVQTLLNVGGANN